MTKDFAGYIYQAILMCMQEHNHLPGVPCDIKDFEESLAAAEILWTREFSEKIDEHLVNRETRQNGQAKVSLS